MKKMIGFIAFWIAVGMLLMLFFTSRFMGLLVCAVLLLIGYNFYYCD